MSNLKQFFIGMCLLATLFLNGCANFHDTKLALSKREDRQIVLVVEEPDSFNSPTDVVISGGGIPLLEIIAGFTAMSIQNDYENIHKKLSTQAESIGLWVDKNSAKNEFIQEIVQHLNTRGFTVSVMRETFESHSSGTTVRQYLLPPQKLRIDPNQLVFGLRVDTGTCSTKRTIPCLCTAWSKKLWRI